MLNLIAADMVVLLHLAFILFVSVGGLLLLKWRWLIWVHLPAVVWAALIEFTGWICPLTPLENKLRMAGGAEGYSSGFIAHYIMPVIYPSALNRDTQIILGAAVIIINIVFYTLFVIRRAHRK